MALGSAANKRELQIWQARIAGPSNADIRANDGEIPNK